MSLPASKLEEILEVADLRRDEVVICPIGPPGIGKSEGVYTFAEKRGRRVVEIICSQILPSEISGITMPDSETKSMEVYDHVRLSSLQDGDVLFFDELFQAPPQVLSACLTLIQERKMLSGRKLPDVLIVAATNALPSPTQIPASIRQRFMFITVRSSFEDWQAYMAEEHGIFPNSALLNRIAADSGDWNIPTPRTLTKLLLWRMACSSEDQVKTWAMVVQEMFDAELVRLLDSSVKANAEQRQVVNALLAGLTGHDREIIENMKGELMCMQLGQMLEVLQQLDCWEGIESVLGKEVANA